jgi:hypothetical protein
MPESLADCPLRSMVFLHRRDEHQQGLSAIEHQRSRVRSALGAAATGVRAGSRDEGHLQVEPVGGSNPSQSFTLARQYQRCCDAPTKDCTVLHLVAPIADG